MTVKSEPFYWLICDTCGAKSTEDSDYVAWGDVGGVWLIRDGRHFCPECVEWCQGLDPTGRTCEGDLVPKGERCDAMHAEGPSEAPLACGGDCAHHTHTLTEVTA